MGDLSIPQYVFLDLDGVINHVGSFGTRSRGRRVKFDSLCVGLVNELFETTSAQMVISSSWRLLKDWNVMVFEAGVDLGSFVGFTPSLDDKRGTEIQSWIRQNVEGRYRYVILDDDNDVLNHQLGHLVKTSFTHGGMTLAHMRHASMLLLDGPVREVKR